MGLGGILLWAAFHIFAKHRVQFASFGSGYLVDYVEGLGECLQPAFVIPAKCNCCLGCVFPAVAVNQGDWRSSLDGSTSRIGLGF